MTASLTYFASNRRFGSHELKGGFENFVDTRVGANAQSSTGYVFMADIQDGAAACRSSTPTAIRFRMFVPGVSRVQRWIPHRGAEFNQTTTSAYVQDRWIVSPQAHAEPRHAVRARGERGHDRAAVAGSVSRRAAPGRGYDVNGDGETVLQATFSQYSGKYNAVQFSRNTNVGNSDRYTRVIHRSRRRGAVVRAGLRPQQLQRRRRGHVPGV